MPEVKLSLQEIRFDKFDIVEHIDALRPDKLRFDITADNRMSPNNEAIDILYNLIEVKLFDPENEVVVISGVLESLYHVPGLLRLSKKNNDGTFQLPDKLLDTISQISIGTLRGVLYAKLDKIYPPAALLPLLEILPIEIPTA